MMGPELLPTTLAGPHLTYEMCSALDAEQTGGRPPMYFAYLIWPLSGISG